MNGGSIPFFYVHRGTTELESVHGMYQAGLIGFKNDKIVRIF